MGVRLLPAWAAIVYRMMVSIMGARVFLLMMSVRGTKVKSATSSVTTIVLKNGAYFRFQKLQPNRSFFVVIMKER